MSKKKPQPRPKPESTPEADAYYRDPPMDGPVIELDRGFDEWTRSKYERPPEDDPPPTGGRVDSE